MMSTSNIRAMINFCHPCYDTTKVVGKFIIIMIKARNTLERRLDAYEAKQ